MVTYVSFQFKINSTRSSSVNLSTLGIAGVCLLCTFAALEIAGVRLPCTFAGSFYSIVLAVWCAVWRSVERK